MWYSERSRRIKILGIIVLAVFTFLLLRLMWLQLFQGTQYKQIAEENRVRSIPIQAPRGTIYDRNGAVLVTSRPSFAVSIIPAEFVTDNIPLLAGLLGVVRTDIELMVRQGQEFPLTPIRLKRDVNEAILTKIEERKASLPGVFIEAVPVRHYIYNSLAAHVFGFIGNINEEEYAARKDKGYQPNDLIGKDGIEKVCEETLRGTDGGKQVEVNALGEELRLLGDKSAIPGKAVVATIDANLQKVAEEALDRQIVDSNKMGQPAKGGAVVVLDVRTGAVLALVSKPDFDPNIFAGGISTTDWNKLINDSRNPLTNRAVQSSYPPGSVFKIVTASAALAEAVTTPIEVFEDKGVYYLEGWAFYGWEKKGLGRLTVADALTWSSDPVFYELGRRLGADKLASYALTYGFGKKSGIILPGEDAGIVPTEEWKQQVYGETWYPGETLIAAIGQGYYLATPLQQALLLEAVANEGVVYRPLLIDKILDNSGLVTEQYEPEVLRNIYLGPEAWQTIKSGLVGVTSRGTAASIFTGFPLSVAGKTGSAETGKGTTHSWFACYCPAEQPQIAVAVFVEEGGEGSVAGAPVVRKILEAYFHR